MRDRAREVIRVAGCEDPGLTADREFDAATNHDAAFLALVAQHVGARVGAGGIAFVDDRHGAVGTARRHESQRDRAVTEIESHRNIVFTSQPGTHVALLGVDDLIVVQTPDALLVADRHQADAIKKLADLLPGELR